MELTKEYVQRITREKLLSFEGVSEAYEEVINEIFKKAKSGLTDYLLYKDSFESVEVYYLVLKLLKLDDYDITTYNNDNEFVDIGW